MNDFYSFLESQLINEEIGFIMSFMESLPSVDKTTLLVYGDWLEDRDDPKGQLIRNAVSQDFGKTLNNAEMARQIGIEPHKSLSVTIPEVGQINGLYIPKQIGFIYSPSDNKWYFIMEDAENIPLSKVPDGILYQMFWSIIGYGVR